MQPSLKSIFFSLLLMSLPLLSIDVTPIADRTPIHEAFISKSTGLSLLVSSALPPPAPFQEQIPAQPEEGLQWIGGYWEWNNESSSYQWVCGVWRRPPPGMQWVPSEYTAMDGGWLRLEGFWSTVPFAHLSAIGKAPPELQQENISPSPGDNYFWVKGYWEYQSVTAQYRFLSGSWQPFDPEWIYTPPKYIWRPAGYFFVAPFWDYPIEKRGQSYRCEGNQESMEPVAPEIWIRELYVYYPDYIPIYWHWWHFHPGFWNDCWCNVPWWGWHNWWALDWHDHWGLWWWWGHPGFPAPFWMEGDIGHFIHGPDEHLLQFFQKIAPPLFITPKGIPSTRDWLDKLGKPIFPKNHKELDALRDSLGNQLPKGPTIRPEGKKGIKTAPLPRFPDRRPIPPGAGKVDLPVKPKLPPKVALPPKPKLPLPHSPEGPHYTPPQEDHTPGYIPPRPPTYQPAHPVQPERPELNPPSHPIPPKPDNRSDVTPSWPVQPDRGSGHKPPASGPSMPDNRPDVTPSWPVQPDRGSGHKPPSSGPSMPDNRPDVTPPWPGQPDRGSGRKPPSSGPSMPDNRPDATPPRPGQDRSPNIAPPQTDIPRPGKGAFKDEK